MIKKLIGITIALSILTISCGKKDTPAIDTGGFNLKSIDGEQINLSDYKGRVVIIDFFATWCPPCKREVPHLVSMYNENKDRGLIILGISLEDETTLKNFKDEFHVAYQILLGTQEVFEKYGVQPIPHTLFIDKKGKTRKVQVGFAPELTPEFESLVQTLLKE